MASIPTLALKVDYEFSVEHKIEKPLLHNTLAQLVDGSQLRRKLRRTIGTDLVGKMIWNNILFIKLIDMIELSWLRRYLAWFKEESRTWIHAFNDAQRSRISDLVRLQYFYIIWHQSDSEQNSGKNRNKKSPLCLHLKWLNKRDEKMMDSMQFFSVAGEIRNNAVEPACALVLENEQELKQLRAENEVLKDQIQQTIVSRRQHPVCILLVFLRKWTCTKLVVDELFSNKISENLKTGGATRAKTRSLHNLAVARTGAAEGKTTSRHQLLWSWNTFFLNCFDL